MDVKRCQYQPHFQASMRQMVNPNQLAHDIIGKGIDNFEFRMLTYALEASIDTFQKEGVKKIEPNNLQYTFQLAEKGGLMITSHIVEPNSSSFIDRWIGKLTGLFFPEKVGYGFIPKEKLEQLYHSARETAEGFEARRDRLIKRRDIRTERGINTTELEKEIEQLDEYYKFFYDKKTGLDIKDLTKFLLARKIYKRICYVAEKDAQKSFLES